MATSKLKQIESALKKAIPIGKALYLGEDKFLTGLLDGSEKIRGFKNDDNEILVVDSSVRYPYPISEMGKPEVDYIYGLSALNILKKIKKNQYDIVDFNFL